MNPGRATRKPRPSTTVRPLFGARQNPLGARQAPPGRTSAPLLDARRPAPAFDARRPALAFGVRRPASGIRHSAPTARPPPSGAAHRSLNRPLIHSSVGGISRRQVLKLCPPLSRMIDEILVVPVAFASPMNFCVAL